MHSALKETHWNRFCNGKTELKKLDGTVLMELLGIGCQIDVFLCTVAELNMLVGLMVHTQTPTKVWWHAESVLVDKQAAVAGASKFEWRSAVLITSMSYRGYLTIMAIVVTPALVSWLRYYRGIQSNIIIMICNISALRWFLSIAFRIPTAHAIASFARAHERVHVQNVRNFPQSKLDSEINAPFLLNKHGDLYVLLHKYIVRILFFNFIGKFNFWVITLKDR